MNGSAIGEENYSNALQISFLILATYVKAP